MTQVTTEFPALFFQMHLLMYTCLPVTKNRFNNSFKFVCSKCGMLLSLRRHWCFLFWNKIVYNDALSSQWHYKVVAAFLWTKCTESNFRRVQRQCPNGGSPFSTSTLEVISPMRGSSQRHIDIRRMEVHAGGKPRIITAVRTPLDGATLEGALSLAQCDHVSMADGCSGLFRQDAVVKLKRRINFFRDLSRDKLLGLLDLAPGATHTSSRIYFRDIT